MGCPTRSVGLDRTEGDDIMTTSDATWEATREIERAALDAYSDGQAADIARDAREDDADIWAHGH